MYRQKLLFGIQDFEPHRFFPAPRHKGNIDVCIRPIDFLLIEHTYPFLSAVVLYNKNILLWTNDNRGTPHNWHRQRDFFLPAGLFLGFASQLWYDLLLPFMQKLALAWRQNWELLAAVEGNSDLLIDPINFVCLRQQRFIADRNVQTRT